MPNKTINTNNTNTNTILTFTSILQQQSVNTRTSNYTNYNSKKQLLVSTQFTQLSTQVQQFITQLKNCFCFTVHNSLQYVIITMYYNNTKTYSFYVVNCVNNNVVQFNSISTSKQYVSTQLSTNTSNK